MKKRLTSFLLFCLLVMAACGNKENTSPASPAFISIWDGFDFGNKAMIANPGVTEAKFKDFCGILAMSKEAERKQQTDTLLSRSERGSEEMFLGFMDLAEKHLHDPNSPLRNEESYIPFLEYAVKTAKIDEAYKERYRYQLASAQKNRVGTIAKDFRYITREGMKGTLKETAGKYVLMYFNNPDCHDCKRVYDIILSSPVLAHLMASGDLTLLAIYPDEDLTSWRKHKEDYPCSWIVARFYGQADRNSYDIPAIPCIYLLDKSKKVLLKDAAIEEVEDYLRQKNNL